MIKMRFLYDFFIEDSCESQWHSAFSKTGEFGMYKCASRRRGKSSLLPSHQNILSHRKIGVNFRLFFFEYIFQTVTVHPMSRAEAKLRIAVTLRAVIPIRSAVHNTLVSKCVVPSHSGFSRKSHEKHLKISGGPEL